MTTEATHAAEHPLPGAPAPDLTVELLRGGTFRLVERSPERFTMVLFFRGLHCPVCRAQLSEIEGRLSELAERGIELVAVSMESEDRTRQLAEEWDLDSLELAYGLTEDQARAWGLFVSSAAKDGEPDRFSEPGLFLVRPDSTVYYASILSMPAGRPHLDDLLPAIDMWSEMKYPPRGAVAS